MRNSFRNIYIYIYIGKNICAYDASIYDGMETAYDGMKTAI